MSWFESFNIAGSYEYSVLYVGRILYLIVCRTGYKEIVLRMINYDTFEH